MAEVYTNPLTYVIYDICFRMKLKSWKINQKHRHNWLTNKRLIVTILFLKNETFYK